MTADHSPTFARSGTPTLRIWGRRNSFNVQKVMWLLGELGLAYRHINAGGAFGGLDTPAFLQMNPHGHVPVIDDDGTVVWESHTVIRYLSARYGVGTFWVEDPAERSRADRWMDWVLASLQPDFMGLFWGVYRTPEDQHNPSMIRGYVARCAAHFQLLDRELATRPYLAGDSLTMGDIPAATCLFRYYGLEIERPHLPHVEGWYRRLAERPAYREHVMVPFDDLRGRLVY